LALSLALRELRTQSAHSRDIFSRQASCLSLGTIEKTSAVELASSLHHVVTDTRIIEHIWIERIVVSAEDRPGLTSHTHIEPPVNIALAALRRNLLEDLRQRHPWR